MLVFDFGKLFWRGYVSGVIWKRNVLDRIRVEVVVEMNCIYIVVFYDFSDNFCNMFFNCWYIWIVIELIVVLY